MALHDATVLLKVFDTYKAIAKALQPLCETTALNCLHILAAKHSFQATDQDTELMISLEDLQHALNIKKKVKIETVKKLLQSSSSAENCFVVKSSEMLALPLLFLESDVDQTYKSDLSKWDLSCCANVLVHCSGSPIFKDKRKKSILITLQKHRNQISHGMTSTVPWKQIQELDNHKVSLMKLFADEIDLAVLRAELEDIQSSNEIEIELAAAKEELTRKQKRSHQMIGLLVALLAVLAAFLYPRHTEFIPASRTINPYSAPYNMIPRTGLLTQLHENFTISHSLSSKTPKTIIIWGTGGLGKTELARQFIDSTKLKFRFWVSAQRLSIDSDQELLRVSQEISASITGKPVAIACSTIEECTAILKFYTILIVLDDVHDPSVVGSVSSLMSVDSQLLITSRNESVFKYHRDKLIFNMPFMEPEDAENLLCPLSSCNLHRLIVKEAALLAGFLPITLKLLAACTHKKTLWDEAFQALKAPHHVDWNISEMFGVSERTNYDVYRTLCEVIHASTSRISQEELEILKEFSAFDRSEHVTLGPLELIAQAHLKTQAHPLLVKLINGSLVHSHHDGAHEFFYLHDLVYCYIIHIYKLNPHQQHEKMWSVYSDHLLVQAEQDVVARNRSCGASSLMTPYEYGTNDGYYIPKLLQRFRGTENFKPLVTQLFLSPKFLEVGCMELSIFGLRRLLLEVISTHRLSCAYMPRAITNCGPDVACEALSFISAAVNKTSESLSCHDFLDYLHSSFSGNSSLLTPWLNTTVFDIFLPTSNSKVVCLIEKITAIFEDNHSILSPSKRPVLINSGIQMMLHSASNAKIVSVVIMEGKQDVVIGRNSLNEFFAFNATVGHKMIDLSRALSLVIHQVSMQSSLTRQDSQRLVDYCWRAWNDLWSTFSASRNPILKTVRNTEIASTEFGYYPEQSMIVAGFSPTWLFVLERDHLIEVNLTRDLSETHLIAIHQLHLDHPLKQTLIEVHRDGQNHTIIATDGYKIEIRQPALRVHQFVRFTLQKSQQPVTVWGLSTEPMSERKENRIHQALICFPLENGGVGFKQTFFSVGNLPLVDNVLEVDLNGSARIAGLQSCKDALAVRQSYTPQSDNFSPRSTVVHLTWRQAASSLSKQHHINIWSFKASNEKPLNSNTQSFTFLEDESMKKYIIEEVPDTWILLLNETFCSAPENILTPKGGNILVATETEGFYQYVYQASAIYPSEVSLGIPIGDFDHVGSTTTAAFISKEPPREFDGGIVVSAHENGNMIVWSRIQVMQMMSDTMLTVRRNPLSSLSDLNPADGKIPSTWYDELSDMRVVNGTIKKREYLKSAVASYDATQMRC